MVFNDGFSMNFLLLKSWFANYYASYLDLEGPLKEQLKLL